MAAQARTIVTGGEPAAWVRLGFAVQEDGSACVGGLRLAAGGDELRAEASGPAITSTAAPGCEAVEHPNRRWPSITRSG